MAGDAGNDTYYVDNTRDKVIEATNAGIDGVITTTNYALAANVENLKLSGTANINGRGNSLVNTVVGNTGNNILDGRGGDDRLIGGGGADTFAFTTALVATNIDTVADFNVAADTIRLENTVFTGLVTGVLSAAAFFKGGGAHDADDRIIYNPTNGALLFDKDGFGSAAAVRFASVSTGLAMTNADFGIV
jgi:Ca2+-binding RTX toxin-like protein